MEMYRPLRAGLFIYECVRLLFLAGAFAVLRPDEVMTFFPWLACVASGALFPLMTLFLWLDISRYGAYGPLYSAGKCVSFFSVIGWCVFFRRNIMAALLMEDTALFMAPGILGVLLFGDLLSVVAGLLIIKKNRPAQAARALQTTAARTPAGGE